MELFWSAFFRIRTEYGEIRSISRYSVQMWENADQNNSEYGHFLRSVNDLSVTSNDFAAQLTQSIDLQQSVEDKPFLKRGRMKMN